MVYTPLLMFILANLKNQYVLLGTILARRRGPAPSVGAVRLTRGPRSQLLQVQPSEKLESVLAGVPVAVAGH